MSDDKRPGGDDKAWVDAGRTRPHNAFDKDDGYSGQQYHRDAEAAQRREDARHDTPHERSEPAKGMPADPEDFGEPSEA